MKNIFGLAAQEKMPLGFCDGRVLASKGPGSRGADQHSFSSKPKSDAKIHRAASRGDVEDVEEDGPWMPGTSSTGNRGLPVRGWGEKCLRSDPSPGYGGHRGEGTGLLSTCHPGERVRDWAMV
jgi:hypothetical protein